ncbi:MAG: S9 family peptidase [Dehalococcoidia bacterium]|nr:S9 family peptidase [Dehalococcoidia bacterium]
MKERRMFGLWESPLSARSLANVIRLSDPAWDTDGRTIGWVEGRSDRGVLVVQDHAEGGAPRDLTPPELSVRAFVGYGGGDMTLSHGAAYFVGQADQRIYRQELAGGPARPITPAFGAASTPTVSPDGRWLVYVSTYEDVDALAIVDTEGRRWPQRIATGRDFYMQPDWHPAGDRLAWVEWDHPNMPWDGTETKLANVVFPEGGLPQLAGATTIAGGASTATYQPIFTRDGAAMLYVSDETGWGHVYRRDLATGETRRISSGEGEFGEPAWNQGMRRITVTPAGRVTGVRTRLAFDTLTVAEPGGELADRPDLHPGYTAIGLPVASPADERIAFFGGSGQQTARLVVADLEAPGAPRVLRRASGETVPAAALSAPQAVDWQSFDGELAHGLYYPPASARFEAEGAPPLVVVIHGGPTSMVAAAWNAYAQFFATRGYAVLLPNYRGSTGYGREYMLKLRHSWGVYDVQDAKYGAEAMAARGLADRRRLVIFGGSAGGYTVLQSLVDEPGFYRAAVCMFGISNQFTLVADTHKFEARYSDSLLGELPGAAARYRDRSPLFHASKIQDPVAVFQGEIDRVVPREQSDAIVGSLRARGVPHEYHLYEGEGHGWRKTETIEAFYTAVERFLRQYVIYT